MRKLFFEILVITLLLGTLMGVFHYYSNQVPDILPGASFGNEVLEKCTRIVFSKERDSTAIETTIYPDIDLKTDDLHMIIADISSFSLLIDGNEFYRFEGSPSSKRMHDISLADSVVPGKMLTIRITSKIITDTLKCLIGSESQIREYAETMKILTAIILGMYLAIIINCVLLYMRKRSETYLFYMTLFTVAVAVTSLLYSSFPIPDFPFRDQLNSGYLNAISKVLCLVLCLKLLKIEPFPGYEDKYPVFLTIITVILVVLLNRVSITLRKVILDFLGYFTVWAAFYGSYKNRPHAEVMVIGTTVSMALMFYTSFINFGIVRPCLFMYFIHLSGLYYITFDFTCLYVVDSIFSQKFKEAERLIGDVEKANRHLDEKVRTRTAELEKTNELLVREHKAKNSVMTNLFHDMRNPLFCAQGYTDIIKEKSPECSEEIQILQTQLDYLSHLTENLFLVAKLEDKQITFTRQAVDISKLCAVIIEEFALAAASAGKQISEDIEQGLIVTGDGFRLKQAISNVISNAIKHTPEKTLIHVSCFRKEKSVYIKINDNGEGIPEESIPHLFDRYFSASSDKTSSGLGLAIAKGIVDAHNGSIEVASVRGEGSCFTIVLPEREIQS